MTLDKLKPGQSGIIDAVEVERALRCRLLDMGLIPGTRIDVRKMAPLGDPIEIALRGYTMTIRKSDAALIKLRPESEVSAHGIRSCGEPELRKDNAV